MPNSFEEKVVMHDITTLSFEGNRQLVSSVIMPSLEALRTLCARHGFAFMGTVMWPDEMTDEKTGEESTGYARLGMFTQIMVEAETKIHPSWDLGVVFKVIGNQPFYRKWAMFAGIVAMMEDAFAQNGAPVPEEMVSLALQNFLSRGDDWEQSSFDPVPDQDLTNATTEPGAN